MATLQNEARNAAMDAIGDLLNSGDLRFETSAHNQVAANSLAADAFGASASGTITANAISDATAAAGTIDHAHLRKSDTTVLIDLTCTITSGGGDIELTSLNIGAGDTISVTSLTITLPAS